MGYNWKSPVLNRLGLFSFSLLAFSFFSFHLQDWVLSVFFLAVCYFQIKWLITYLNEKNAPENQSSIDSIHFDEVSSSFVTESQEPVALKLQELMNGAFASIKNNRRDRDAELLFFKNIVMHAGVGLLVFRENGKIEIFNSAARKLLKASPLDHLDALRKISPHLVDAVVRLKTGGRDLVKMSIGEEETQLSVYAIELNLRGDTVKLISLQNIQSELEEKEMQAWQGLVRVLTHEIMNSVTPISSLASIVETDLQQHIKGNTHAPLTREELNDIHLSLQTISKRSDGLIHFVKEFRSLTAIPKPVPISILIKNLLEEMLTLHKKEMSERGIQTKIEVYPDDLTLMADKNLIEQVLINLIRNAIQAFDDQPSKMLHLRGYLSEKSRPVISILDNGPGIDPEALEKIFIPFYTTKKSGSGIGLSLSRQIMHQHQGTLTVKSTLGKGTEFYIRF